VRTEVVRLDPKTGPWPELARIARIVDDGGLVAFPTETVYGIAANLRDEAAVRRLYQAKGRADEKPLTVHLASAAAAAPLVKEISRPAQKLIARFWPGPLNVVIPDRHGRPTGFRVPDLRSRRSSCVSRRAASARRRRIRRAARTPSPRTK